MPGSVPYTSTIALTNVTSQYALRFINEGIDNIIKNDPHLAKGINFYKGKCLNKAVERSLLK